MLMDTLGKNAKGPQVEMGCFCFFAITDFHIGWVEPVRCDEIKGTREP